MKKLLKYALVTAGAFLLCAGIVLGWLVLTFDVRDHEPRIVALVKEKTGRTLAIRGETTLSFWPDLGLTLGPVTLSERDSDMVFAEVANARLSAKLRPLLDRELVSDELVLEGASVRIVRGKDGRLNIDDLLGGEGGTPDFDIARVRVAKSRVAYEDLALGTRHEVWDIDLVTGRLASGVTSPVVIAFKAADAAGAYAGSAKAEGRLTFDFKQRAYAFDAVTIRIEGKLAALSEVMATIKGAATWTPDAFRFGNAAVDARFVASGRPFEVNAGSTAIATTKEGLSVEALAADVRSKTAENALQVKLATPRVDWKAGAIAAPATALELDLARDARKVHATIEGDLRATDGARVVDIADAQAKFSASGAGLPKKGVAGALTGSASIDARHERVQAKVAGTVLDTRVKATLSGAGFSPPAYSFAIDLDALDLDRLDIAGGGGQGGGFDLAELSGTRAAGTLRIGTFRSAGVVAKNVQLALKP